jgi:hypothetical protein
VVQRPRLALLALCVAAAIAGCGGDDDDDGALTKAEFVDQANAICKDANAQIDAAAKDLPQDASKAELEQFATETLLPNVQGQIDDVGALEPPSEDQDQITEFLDSAQAEVDRLEKDPLIIFSDEQTFEETNKLGRAYGLTECSDDD